MEEELRSICADIGLPEAPPPDWYRIGTDSTPLADLLKAESWRPPLAIPEEVTEANFARLVFLEVFPEEEDASLTDVLFLFQWWLMVVSSHAGERVGFLHTKEV